MDDKFTVPDDVDLLTFFGAEPVERSVADGYWCYEAVDARGVCLRLSFNLYERSVQTTVTAASGPIAIVSHEGAVRMTVSDDGLECSFSYSGARATLVVRTAGGISVQWSTLRVR